MAGPNLSSQPGARGMSPGSWAPGYADEPTQVFPVPPTNPSTFKNASMSGLGAVGTLNFNPGMEGM